MEPFSKDDPLHKLLGKARPVEPRPNFTQNVLRAVRNAPQDRGFWVQLRNWFSIHPAPKFALLAAAAALLLVVNTRNSVISTAPAVTSAPPVTAPMAEPPSIDTMGSGETSSESMVLTELSDIDQLSDLLASQDTSALTDGEIAMLLY